MQIAFAASEIFVDGTGYLVTRVEVTSYSSNSAAMLVLSALHQLLSQVLSSPHLHTAALLTPAGGLVSFASSYQRPKDEIRVLVGLSGEIWRETRGYGIGMVDCELGRVVVVPVNEIVEDRSPSSHSPKCDSQPLLLVALNATNDMDWGELREKGKALANHLAKPLGKYRDILSRPETVTSAPAPVAGNSKMPLDDFD
ncbi:hypothetical protein AX15_004001 [Amanita polypyramis BW_CC]|nr:hypothetical protein AX15_004001 [Amanita polypyramis BW_CC]